VGAIENLDFVIAMEDDPGVGPLGDHELHVDLDVLVVAALRDEALGLSNPAVDQHAFAPIANQAFLVPGVETGVFG